MKAFVAAALIAASFGAASVHAANEHTGHGMAAHAAPAAKLVDGQVKKVDKPAGKITLAHGPLENLGMPAMTMAFRVKDAAALDRVKPGDKVRFLAEDVGGVITVTQIEAAR